MPVLTSDESILRRGKSGTAKGPAFLWAGFCVEAAKDYEPCSAFFDRFQVYEITGSESATAKDSK